MASALSGTGKSEAFRHLSAPFYAFEHEMAERWKSDKLPDLQADVDMLESEIGKLKKDAAKCKDAVEREEIRQELKAKKKALLEVMDGMAAPALSCEDVTSERLAVMLSNNQEQLASLSSDAGSILNNLLGRYSKLDRPDECIYLKSFSGDRCRVDRQTRAPVWLKEPYLSALWLVQPDKLDTLLDNKGLTDGGLAPRLLVCHSHAEPTCIIEGAEGIPEATTLDWGTLVKDLINTFRMGAAPVTIQPTPEALSLLNAHYNAIVARRKSDLKDVTIYAARWNEQAWRIAVCLYAGLHGKDAGRHDLHRDTANNAILLAGWFAGEQLSILARVRRAAYRAKVGKVQELLADKPSGITTRDLCRARIAGNAEEARTLLTRLEAEGELVGRDSKPGTGGHVTRTFTKE